MAEPNEPSVLHETTPEGITTITINRPHVRNAVNSTTARSLAAAFTSFESDPTQKVCILTGAGTTFCAGYDLHELSQNPAKQPITADPASTTSTTSTTSASANVTADQGPMGPSRMSFSKPLIAAISGHAVAGGLELSLLADMRIADTSAIFGVFCRRFGVPLIDGGTVRLPKIVGFGRAMDMILTGRPVDAHEALGMGLANRVVEEGKALEEARRVARALLEFPQECMRADLVSAHFGAFEAGSKGEALGFEAEGGARVIQTESVSGAKRFSTGEGRGGEFVKGKL